MAGRGEDERERAKKPGETDLQWRLRIAQFELDRLRGQEPLVTPEAERHGDYRDGFVMHVETQTLALTKRNYRLSPFLDLFNRGTITKDQLGAAQEIASIAEMLTRIVSIRSGNMDARVDNSGAGRDALVERVGQVRLEITYSRWRSRILYIHRQMILDMLLRPGAPSRKARQYGMDWPRARRLLIKALDHWLDTREKVAKQVDQDDIEAAHKRVMRKAG